MTISVDELLPDELLDTIRGRAAGYDESNGFCHEDIRDLARAGYLKMFTPADDGGLGYGLEQVAAAQTRLATAAPATALAVNMHLVWNGVAHALKSRGDSSLDYVLAEAAAGEIFGFGISEPGNDSVLFDSKTTAEPTGDGGYRFTGTKIFTSLSPVWTRLGVFGKDTTGGEESLVYGFVDRAAAGYTIKDDWNTLGMRASQSCTTVLEGAEVPAARVFRKMPVGPNPDALVFAIFATFETLLAAVYTGIGRRALDIAVDAAHRRTSAKHDGRSYAQDPDVRRKVAAAAMALEAVQSHVSTTASQVDALADHGQAWFPKLVSVKVHATEQARDIVDTAIRVAGGGSYFRGSELERLYRDVLAGSFHPSNEDSAHATVANAWLGPVED